MPKLQTLTFETAIIEWYKRRESSVEEALIEMYLAGVSVRRVEDITEALCGTRVSPGTFRVSIGARYAPTTPWKGLCGRSEEGYGLSERSGRPIGFDAGCGYAPACFRHKMGYMAISEYG